MLVEVLKFGWKVTSKLFRLGLRIAILTIMMGLLFLDLVDEEHFERVKREWHEDGVLTGDAPG